MRTPSHKWDTLIWLSAFILANMRGTVIWDILKQGLGLTFLPWIEITLWIALFLLVLDLLNKDGFLAEYLYLWKRNCILVLFIGIAFLSLIWSISFSETLYRCFALLFASLIGAYFGTRYSLREILEILHRFGAILLIVCFVLAVFLPQVGAMNWEPYNGAWRGVFWHKNQFGPLATFFGMVFLILAFEGRHKEGGSPFLYFVFFLFSLINVFFSKSVAGYMTTILTTLFTFLAVGWLNLRHHLKPVHYYALGGFGLLVATILAFNLDFFFGLFNRDTSLTGRLPLWEYLIREVVLARPLQGYGFGAFWRLASSRLETQHVLGWLFPVVISDNGFLDILLHVGLLGFVPFLGFLLMVTLRSLKYAVQHKTITAFFPLLVMIFAFFANLTFSFFLETETFLWLVIVAVSFMISRSSGSFTS